MLFIPEDVEEAMGRLMDSPGIDPVTRARRLLELWPGFAPARLLLGVDLSRSGKVDEAESALWDALGRDPCEAACYFALADIRMARNQGDLLAKRLHHLGLWKLALLDEVPPHFQDVFAETLGGDASEPEAYELMATREENELKGAIDPPEVAGRLRPFRLLNDLQRGGPNGLGPATLQQIIEHKAECEPILRNALRAWAAE